MSMIKYRVHEVAKDFGMPTKAVTQILTDYVATPNNHMQVLETPELDVIFEYITQHHQVESLEEIFKVEPKSAPPQEEKKAVKSKSLERAFSAQIPQDVYDRLQREMEVGDDG